MFDSIDRTTRYSESNPVIGLEIYMWDQNQLYSGRVFTCERPKNPKEYHNLERHNIRTFFVEMDGKNCAILYRDEEKLKKGHVYSNDIKLLKISDRKKEANLEVLRGLKTYALDLADHFGIEKYADINGKLHSLEELVEGIRVRVKV